MPPGRAGRATLALLGMLCAGAIGEVFFLTPHGLLTSPDSVDYVAAARSLVAGQGLRGVSGEPLTLWPPLFSALIALPGFAGIDALPAARILNALCLGGCVFGTGWLLSWRVGSPTLALAGAGALLLAEPVVWPSLWVWSDPLFSAIALAFVACLAHALEAATPRRVALLASIAAAGTLTRYIGLALIAAGAIALLVWPEADVWRMRVRRALAFTVVASLPVAFWLARNSWLGEGLAGRRGAPLHSPAEASIGLAQATSTWLVPSQSTINAPGPLGLALGLLALLAFGLPLLLRTGTTAQSALARSCALVAAIYLASLVAAAATSRVEPLDRMLMPLFAPWLVALALCAQGRHASRLLVVAGLAWMLAAGLHTRKKVAEAYASGRLGYTSRPWRDSKVLAWLRENPLPGRIYSNNPRPVRLWARIPARRARELDDLLAARAAIAAEDSYLVWFPHTDHRPNAYPLRALAPHFRLEGIVALDDGGVVRLRVGPSP